ncbi:peptidylglycine alpha-hydroxylating monooxygenase [Leptidea sinapis]|uniref:peptidylglycine alpha-hydroxylating monooxygenase n=1 Tax=Leptidea sinapis TaxID=189913 RepID=UPI00212C67A2|nr:peptidylglycine alpha-hydroxylating monooxygenase [Leptidea sinapis]XP_050680603.1 peptidylglycine alpha-hydroxylating monooxygenase [Leptidea sinapis]
MFKFSINALRRLFILSFYISVVISYEVDTYDFLMPNVYPHRDELYLCTPIRIAPTQKFYIVGFKPNATMNTAHHMLLYGCTEPGSNDSVWSCGEMQSNEVDDMYTTSSPCKSGSQVVYAWARDAPSLQLPQDVGFLIGDGSPIKYLVLQVHYMAKFPEGKTDDSGVFLQYTTKQMRRQAGVLLMGTSGVIGPNRVEHMETACTIREDKVIHPFAFRTHTHSLGKLVSGYVVCQSERGDKWNLIGSKDPLLPQMFYPVEDPTPIRPGDIVAARCVMNNTHNHVVKIGATNKDEMCNFYLMYWVENTSPLQMKYCFSAGPPFYYWSTAQQNFNRIPDLDDFQDNHV